MNLKLLVTFAIIFSISTLHSQIKFWDLKTFKPIKTEGTYCTLTDITLPKGEKIKSPESIVGTIIPLAIKYGNSALKNITKRKEEDYKSECQCINGITMNIDNGKHLESKIQINQIAHKLGSFDKETEGKKSNGIIEVFNQTISISKKNNFLIVELDKEGEYSKSPVKIKKNRDFVVRTLNVSIKALVRQEIDTLKSLNKIIDLGNQTLINPLPNFNKTKVISNNNQLNWLLPLSTDTGMKITIEKIFITANINHISPYGLTPSAFNSFLENNSDTNELLLNTILIGESEE